MSEAKKKAGVWPWIVALLIGLPVLYLASFGPAFWITGRLNWGARLVPVVYKPIIFSVQNSEAIRSAMDWYMVLWLPPDTEIDWDC
jgi:hypothetical protein